MNTMKRDADRPRFILKFFAVAIVMKLAIDSSWSVYAASSDVSQSRMSPA